MFVAVTVLLLLPTRLQAQELTVILSPGAVNFALTKGSAVNAGNATIAATTSWSLKCCISTTPSRSTPISPALLRLSCM